MIFEERHFEYGNFISRKYGLIFAHVGTSTMLQVAGDISSTYIFNKKNNIRYVIGNDYTDSPLSFDIDIVTDDFKPLTKEDRRAVEKELFNKPNFNRLYVDIADDCYGESYEFIQGEMKRLYLNCRLLNPEKIEDGSGRVVGYKCTVECDSGYLMQDEVVVTVNLEDIEADAGYKNFSIYVDNDTNSYVYPVVTIATDNSECYFAIRNESDRPSRTTDFLLTQIDTDGDGTPDSSATIVMDGDTNYMYRFGDFPSTRDTSIYDEFRGNRNFVRLIDGENRIGVFRDDVTGNPVSISFKWTNRRFL